MGIKNKSLWNKALFFSLVCGLVFASVHCSWAMEGVADSEVVDRAMGHGDAAEIVVAKVNGANITMAALMGRMLDIAQDRFGRREITPILAEKIKGESIEQLVMAEIVFQEASKGVSVTPEEVKVAVDAKVKAFGGEDVLKKYMAAYQLKSRAEFAEQIRRFLVVQKYINENFISKIQISDEMIAVAYQEGRSAFFNKPEIVQVTKIIFFLDPALGESYEKIKEVKSKLINELSADPTKLVVDGTFIVQEDIKLSESSNKKLYDVAKKLDKFAISDVVESNGTLHLLQLTGYQPAVNKSLEDATGYIKNELYGRMKDAMVKEWMVTLREGADVEIVDVTR